MSDESKEKHITGTVRTNVVGSGCEFVICTREEWEAMTEEQQQKALVDAMWDSGILDVFPNEPDQDEEL